jgi:type IV pilus assembly protein PilQ
MNNMTFKKISILVLVLVLGLVNLCLPGVIKGQNLNSFKSTTFDSISEFIPGLNQTVDLSVNNLPIQELIRSIAIANRINVVIDPSIKLFVTNNFVDVPAKDVFSYLCNTYELEVALNGKIISFVRAKQVEPEIKRRVIDIAYDSVTTLLSLNLRNDSLTSISKLITTLTGNNVLVMPESRNKIVSIYLKSANVEEALTMLAFTNNLELEKEKGAFILGAAEDNTVSGNNKDGIKKGSQGFINVEILGKDRLKINAVDASISDLVRQVSKQCGIEYFIYSEIKGNTYLYLDGATYEEFLKALFNTTLYTYKFDNGIYLIGERQAESLRETRVYQLKYRSIKDVNDAIPKGLITDMSVFEFVELNSLIFSGSKPAINEVISFIEKIDKVVPLISIDVIIIDNRSGFEVSSGITAGLAKEPVATSGEVFSGIDVTFGSESINKLINSFNGFGSVNLGNVTPNFYVSLKFMEQQGIIKVRSTPKLSTLNGHEANIVIGETEYYVQENTDFIINQSTSQKTTKQYKDVTAEFSLKITPYVSGDEQITLEVTVKQSTFTTRITPDAPPGQLSRDFSSLIRVKNNEMILLGGLEVSSLNETSSGLPWISRLPIIKWLFSSRDKNTQNNKLNIFIKPTIIY